MREMHNYPVEPGENYSAAKLRVVEEINQLRERITKLNDFIRGNDIWFKMSKESQHDLIKQLDIMCDYEAVLRKRLFLWEDVK